MIVGIIIVGVNGWEKYTLKLVNSIKQHEESDDYRLVVFDNGSDPPYPHFHIRNNELSCYAAAMNSGIGYLSFWNYDWVLILNNDVLCTGPFMEKINSMDPNHIYGNDLHRKERFGHEWLDGWLYLLPRQAIEAVGHWDENFQVAAFEDADFCLRAKQAGFLTKKSDLPFTHLETIGRDKLAEHRNYRFINLEYLLEKHDLEEIK